MMNAKILRSAVLRIKHQFAEYNINTETAYQAFIYTVTEVYLHQSGFSYMPEQLVPELNFPVLPEELYQNIKSILQQAFPESPCPVQIIGWMHQYYHADEKDRIFSDKNHKQITEAEIPVSTQFFTPEWLSESQQKNIPYLPEFERLYQ